MEDRVMEEVRTAAPRCGMGGLVNEIATVRISDVCTFTVSLTVVMVWV
jgi:hypothetical protein